MCTMQFNSRRETLGGWSMVKQKEPRTEKQTKIFSQEAEAAFLGAKSTFSVGYIHSPLKIY
eukprot:1773106-Amphidinium_carterae.1